MLLGEKHGENFFLNTDSRSRRLFETLKSCKPINIFQRI